jgi:hypothetical protein
MSRTFVRLTIGFGLLALSACASISPAGLIAASRLDPLGTPPDEIGVAVGVPDTVRLSSGDAVMRISLRGGSSASTILVSEEVLLQLVRDEGGTIPANAPDETVYVASLLPEDAARFAAAQAEIRRARESGVEGIGTLNVEVVGGCFVGPVPEGLPASTWLRTDPAGPFVPLTRRVDAFQATGGAVLDILSPC